MEKKVLPFICVGLALYAACMLTNRFIVPVSDFVAIPVYLLSSLLVVYGLLGGNNKLFYPSDTKKIADNIYAVRTRMVNFFLYDTGRGVIAFDTGLLPALSKKELKRLGISPESVSHIFLTHSDYDHVGGLSLFTNAVIYLSKGQNRDGTERQSQSFSVRGGKSVEYHALEDREIVHIHGTEVKTISTPGHTKDSACYLINGKILVTGDTLRIKPDGQFIPFMFFQNRDHEGDKRSLKMLDDEGFLKNSELILSGHTGVLFTRR